MDGFSEKSLISLGDYYVYGLIDPRTNQFFILVKALGTEFLNTKKKVSTAQTVKN